MASAAPRPGSAEAAAWVGGAAAWVGGGGGGEVRGGALGVSTGAGGHGGGREVGVAGGELVCTAAAVGADVLLGFDNVFAVAIRRCTARVDHTDDKQHR